MSAPRQSETSRLALTSKLAECRFTALPLPLDQIVQTLFDLSKLQNRS